MNYPRTKNTKKNESLLFNGYLVRMKRIIPYIGASLSEKRIILKMQQFYAQFLVSVKFHRKNANKYKRCIS